MGNYDVEALGKDFLPKVVGDQSFRDKGYLSEPSGNYFYAVINPHSYALYIWKKDKRGYVETAEALGSAVFTNGPQMKPATEENGYWHVIKRGLKGTRIGIGVAVGGILVGLLFPPAGAIILGVGGGLIIGGGVIGALNGLDDWLPYGKILGTKFGVDDNGIDTAGTAWFGRKAFEFPDYAVGEKQTYGGYIEFSDGLIKLIKDWKPEVNDNGYKGVTKSPRFVSWGLVPIFDSSNLPKEVTADVQDYVLTSSDFTRNNASLKMVDGSTLEGLIVVVGVNRDEVKAPDPGAVVRNLPAVMQKMGVRDAIATDGGPSAMIGSGSKTYIKPDVERRRMQKYGLCCLPRK